MYKATRNPFETLILSCHGQPAHWAFLSLNCYTLMPVQGVSSHGLEKSWNLTPGFGKFIKAMEIIRHSLAKLHGLVSLLNTAHHHMDIDMSSMKIEIDLIFVITFCLNWLQIIQGLTCCIIPPCLGTCLFHAISHVKGHWICSFGLWKVMEKLLSFSGYTLEFLKVAITKANFQIIYWYESCTVYRKSRHNLK